MQLGLGAASLTKFCHKHLRMHTTAIELNPQVVAACRLWFKLPADTAKLKVVLGDAAEVARHDHWHVQEQQDYLEKPHSTSHAFENPLPCLMAMYPICPDAILFPKSIDLVLLFRLLREPFQRSHHNSLLSLSRGPVQNSQGQKNVHAPQ